MLPANILFSAGVFSWQRIGSVKFFFFFFFFSLFNFGPTLYSDSWCSDITPAWVPSY